MVPGLLVDVRLGHAELVNTFTDGAQGLVQDHIFQAGIPAAINEMEVRIGANFLP